MAQNKSSIKSEYKDGAIVKISASYFATNYNSISTKLFFPTKGFSLSVFHPSNMTCKVDPYGFDSESKLCEQNITDRGFTFNYPDWILPHGGVYVAVEEKTNSFVVAREITKTNMRTSLEEGSGKIVAIPAEGDENG